MIEINLIPDIKQELLKARRIRTYVISIAVLVGIASVAVVVLLAIYLYGVQTVRGTLADGTIKDKSAELQDVEDLPKTLTIQNQLSKLSDMHATKNIDSRFFSLMAAINPEAPNEVTISSAVISSASKTIKLEGQAVNGFDAAEALKKTILGTTLEYTNAGSNEVSVAQLTDEVVVTDMSLGEDSSGKKVLRFTFTFTYDESFFARTSENARVLPPNRANVTDSFLRLPQSLFGERASEIGGGQ